MTQNIDTNHPRKPQMNCEAIAHKDLQDGDLIFFSDSVRCICGMIVGNPQIDGSRLLNVGDQNFKGEDEIALVPANLKPTIWLLGRATKET